MKTERYTITIGINAGYNGTNILDQNKILSEVKTLWQQMLQEELNYDGIQCSAVFYPTCTVYSTKFGCPLSGEDTITFTSTRNPKFVQDSMKYKFTLLKMVNRLKQDLHQSTVTVEIIDMEYLEEKN